MKFTIVIFAAIFAVAFAYPGHDSHVETLKLDSDVQPEGFKFDVATSDGTSHHAEGVLEHAGSEHESLKVHGAYSFVADDGHEYTVHYVADENGYQPEGAHLPQAPEPVHHH